MPTTRYALVPLEDALALLEDAEYVFMPLWVCLDSFVPFVCAILVICDRVSLQSLN